MDSMIQGLNILRTWKSENLRVEYVRVVAEEIYAIYQFILYLIIIQVPLILIYSISYPPLERNRRLFVDGFGGNGRNILLFMEFP